MHSRQRLSRALFRSIAGNLSKAWCLRGPCLRNQISKDPILDLEQFGAATVLLQVACTQMAATSQFIGSLISQSFGTFSTLLSLTESFQQLFGTCRRVSDVLLVIDEIEQERHDDELRVASMVQPHTPRRGERIGLTDATIVAPDGKRVASNLTFSVEHSDQPHSLVSEGSLSASRSSGSNLLISGGSGVGKTTIVRVLSGIWSAGLQDGHINRPDPAHYKHMAIVPQQPLISTTPLSLLDMLTYPEQRHPNSAEETDAIHDLSILMKRLEIYYIVERCGRMHTGSTGSAGEERQGWHAVVQWETFLSMGECQCFGIIRTLYHQPAFAVLDEAVSAMSSTIAQEAFTILVRRIPPITLRCYFDVA